MKRYLMLALVSTAVLAGCSNQAAQEHNDTTKPVTALCQTKAMPGGWQDSGITPDVQQAINTMVERMNNASPVKSVNRVRTQVVNGINYAIEIQLENGQFWHGIVYRNIRGDYLIDSVAKQGKMCP
ncbi:cystatin domain-containing protein [Vibrio taketomensis]|uniref:cystatin domain-containing protein n=1 Tax=Vibrio taketomensis TaxID=2572923 RepID=UPI001389C92B|nr:cystatin domain-containing protein [Vibrio taketomensis]